MPTDDALTPTGSAGGLGQALRPTRATPAQTGGVPDYLKDTYTWAYLSPWGVRLFDHPFVVRAILWGNYDRLKRAACEEIEPGWSVLQTACVYGDLSANLADRIGPSGSLDIVDVAPIQVQHCREKLAGRTNAQVECADARDIAGRGPYDAVCCFFLLHEVPEDLKSAIVPAVIDRVKPGGRAVFVDYHRPGLWHPLRPLMRLVFALLEPFAVTLWRREIVSYLPARSDIEVRKSTFFGGLYQKVVVTRRGG